VEKGVSDFEIIFSPRSVAVIGASDNPGKLGFHVMKSLIVDYLMEDPEKREILKA
jgi:acyl-CoA synthetase (NDP forming)